MLSTVLIVILILALVGALPTWGYSRNWGYGPGGGYYGPPQQGWRYHQWNGPGSDGPPSPPKG